MIQGIKIAGKCRAYSSPTKVASIAPVVTESIGARKVEKLSLSLSIEDMWMDQYDHPLQVESPQEVNLKVVSFDISDGLVIDDDLNRSASSPLSLLPLTFSTPPKKRFFHTEFACLSPPSSEKHVQVPFVLFSDELEKSWMDDMTQEKEDDHAFPSMS